jgi:hypothetical protein
MIWFGFGNGILEVGCDMIPLGLELLDLCDLDLDVDMGLGCAWTVLGFGREIWAL